MFFTNPQNGKVYNLLLVGKTKSGTNIVRVLDSEGGYIRTVKIKPKKIIIIDDFSNQKIASFDDIVASMCDIKKPNNECMYANMGHGDFVKTLAKRTNPFAEYEIFDVSIPNSRYLDNNKINKALDIIQERINRGEKIDYISCSFGRCVPKKLLEQSAKEEFGMTLNDVKLMSSQRFDGIDLALENFSARNPQIRILKSAGNDGKDALSIELLNGKIEGVGSLSPKGVVSDFSSSRNSLYTQHYERGEYPYTATPFGISLTGGKSTEIPLGKGIADDVLRFHGQKPKFVSPEELEVLNELEQNYIKATSQAKESAKIAYENYAGKLSQEGKMILDADGKYHLPCSLPQSKEEAIMAQVHAIFGGDKLSSTTEFELDLHGNLIPSNTIFTKKQSLNGTSFSAPVRTAKLALNNMLEGVL